MASNTTFAKRQKERARQDKQREKDAKKKQRREDRDAQPKAPTEPGVDPDIAGIVPGPQPVVEDDY
jgi:sRNA-binding protein